MKTVFSNRSDLIRQALVDAVNCEYTFIETNAGFDEPATDASVKKIREYREYYERRYNEKLISHFN